MEQQFKGLDGEWYQSEFKDGKKYVTREDGHTYLVDLGGMVGHTDCYKCTNK